MSQDTNVNQSPSSQRKSNRPDGNIVCYVDGEAIELGAYWLNGEKKTAVIFEVENLPKPPQGDKKLKAWLCPRTSKKEKS